MKTLFQSDKKGVSVIISYVLLITIAVALSVLVYNWLKFYVDDTEPKIECKDGTNLVIQNYKCTLPYGANKGELNLTVKNNGRFNIDGFIVRVHDRPNAELGIYSFPEDAVAIDTAKTYNRIYQFDEITDTTHSLTKITLLEVQPFIYDEGEKIFCQKVSSQSVTCQ